MEHGEHAQGSEQLVDPHAAELKNWFETHPEEKDTQSLPLEEKKQFILKYYNEEVNADELLEKMMEEAEKVLDAEIAAGKNKPPFSEPLVLSVMAIAKAKVIDELVEEVGKFYEERRKLVKGKEISDPGVIKITQVNCSKMAMSLQQKILQQVEEEAKGRGFDLEQFMNIAVMVAMNDVQAFVEIERLFAHRQAEKSKDAPIDKERVIKYVNESLNISEQILKGEIDSSVIFIYPHLLADKLYNQTGFESEEIVLFIRRLVKDNTIDAETVDLIVKEAYSAERSRESCTKKFDEQMQAQSIQAQAAYEAQMKRMADIKDPLEDPSIKKMIEMGLMNKEEVEELYKQGGPMALGGMPPGMGMPGMGMPGMGGMPPGMMPTPEMMMEFMAMMGGMGGPGGMPGMPPGMMPPGMFDPQAMAEMMQMMGGMGMGGGFDPMGGHSLPEPSHKSKK